MATATVRYGRLDPDEMRRARIPEECGDCGDWNVAYRDVEGIWVECACDAGYVSLDARGRAYAALGRD